MMCCMIGVAQAVKYLGTQKFILLRFERKCTTKNGLLHLNMCKVCDVDQQLGQTQFPTTAVAENTIQL